MDLERERERERELTFNQPVERKRELGNIWIGSDFLTQVNMSLSSNNVSGYQESLRKILTTFP